MIQFNELGYGIELRLGNRSVFLQGDDADIARKDAEVISSIWNRPFRNQYGIYYRKDFGPWKSYEEHLTTYFSEYF
jgi:hypothetical protein